MNKISTVLFSALITSSIALQGCKMGNSDKGLAMSVGVGLLGNGFQALSDNSAITSDKTDKQRVQDEEKRITELKVVNTPHL